MALVEEMQQMLVVPSENDTSNYDNDTSNYDNDTSNYDNDTSNYDILCKISFVNNQKRKRKNWQKYPQNIISCFLPNVFVIRFS